MRCSWRVRIGVQEDRGDSGNAELSELPGYAPRLVLVEGREHGARGVQALGHLEHAIRRDRALGLAPAVEVAVARDVVAADLEHVLEARRRDERRRRRLGLENRVRRPRRPVEHAHDVGRRAIREDQHLPDRGDEAAREVAGVDGVFATQVAPVTASASVMSVNMPPTSMAMVPLGSTMLISSRRLRRGASLDRSASAGIGAPRRARPPPGG